MPGEKIIPQYDVRRVHDKYDLARPDYPSLTLQYLGNIGLLENRKTLLDIGTGDGHDPRVAVQNYEFDRAIGIDTSMQAVLDAEAVKRDKDHLSPADQAKVHYLNVNIHGAQEVLPEHEKFDLITSNSMIQLLNPGEMVEKFKAVKSLLNPEGGIFAVSTKTLNSGDRRPVREGGKSRHISGMGQGYRLHQCDDGLRRYYYSPNRVTDILHESGFTSVETETVVTPFDGIDDCEFIIAVAH